MIGLIAYKDTHWIRGLLISTTLALSLASSYHEFTKYDLPSPPSLLSSFRIGRDERDKLRRYIV